MRAIHEHRMLLGALLKWSILGAASGLLAGSAAALFLWSLDLVTLTREANPSLLFLLPVGGFAVGWLYERFGRLAGRGNNLILDQLHGAGEGVPLRMAPMVLAGTLLTHLLGGSAGREGTAVQMGGSLADWLARILRLQPHDRRLLLMSGMAGGFASLFGTPVAGTIFGVEVLRIGGVRYDGLLPCLVAALVGDQIAHAWGVHHTTYIIGGVPQADFTLLLKVGLTGLIFGLGALLFIELVHGAKRIFGGLVPAQRWRPAAGGVVVIILVWLLGTRAYIGLGIPVIKVAFVEALPPLAFFWKSLLTAVTLGSGFQGGEVTPLFFVGAALGNWLGQLLALPLGFTAGLGFVAVFAAAANTPLACIAMAVELFGHEPLPHFALAIIFAYIFSGHRGIYTAQRLEVAKAETLPARPEKGLP